METLELLAVVAVLKDFPEHHIKRGQVGTVVELLAPDSALVEFSDDQGHTYALPALSSDSLMRLHHLPLDRAA